MSINKRIREIRKDNGQKQQEMADSFGIAINTLRRYEKGSGTPSTSFFIEMALRGINTHWLITGDGDKYSFKSPSVDPFQREIWKWLEECTEKDPGYKDWFRIQFEKIFPDFKEWKNSK